MVVGPEDAQSFAYHWKRNEGYPFIGIPDPDSVAANLYGQEVGLTGRLPTLVIIDKNGRIQHQHHGQSMQHIPKNDTVLQILDTLNHHS